MDAKGNSARVLLDADVAADERETARTGRKPRDFTPTAEVPVADVWPPAAGVSAGRGGRSRFGSEGAVSELPVSRVRPRAHDLDDDSGEGA